MVGKHLYIYIYHVKSQGNKKLQGSTVSSWYWQVLCILVRLQAWAWYDNTCQIQPVQRDRMPSGPTKYMSVFKYCHLEWKKMQHFWMHRTTCHHYGCTWPSNKSWHQIISNSHIQNVLNVCSYRKISKSFHFLEFFFGNFHKNLHFCGNVRKNLYYLWISGKIKIDITLNNVEHNAMCQYHQVNSWLVYCFLLTDENNDGLWHVIQHKSYPVLFATQCVLDISR